MQLKNSLFYIIIIIIIPISLIEVISYGLLKYYSVDADLFYVNEYVEKTNDERIVTLKKNQDVYYENENVSVITSSYRTRISSKEKKLKNINDRDRIKILFLGDSVPFGHGVDAEKSIPYLFQKKNVDIISINGALPAYSLAQSVARFKIEFKNIKNLKYVYLQIYSPASQYGTLGNKYREDNNWWNKPNQILRPYNLINIDLPFYGEPYFYILLKKLIIRKKTNLLFFEPNKESDERYKKHIVKELNKIYQEINNINAKLIIAPVTIPSHAISKINFYHLRAVNMLNEVLKDFSKKNVIFFDTISILRKESEDNFIDNCCHLLKKGTDVVSSHLSTILNNL